MAVTGVFPIEEVVFSSEDAQSGREILVSSSHDNKWWLLRKSSTQPDCLVFERLNQDKKILSVRYQLIEKEGDIIWICDPNNEHLNFISENDPRFANVFLELINMLNQNGYTNENLILPLRQVVKYEIPLESVKEQDCLWHYQLRTKTPPGVYVDEREFLKSGWKPFKTP